MPKRKRKKPKYNTINRALAFKEDGQEYCKVIKMLGDARLQGECMDSKTRICKIRGSMSGRRKVWISAGDYVLISLREFQDDKADVILKYTKEEVKKLIKFGEIEGEEKTQEEDIGVDFGYEEEKDEFNLEKNFDNI